MSSLSNAEGSSIRNGHWPFFGCFMQQTPNAVLSLNRLLNQYNFDKIIELGTHDGGLSSLFALYCLGSKIKADSPNSNEPSLYKNNTHHKSPKTFYTFDLFLRDTTRLDMLVKMGAIFDQVDFLHDEMVIKRLKDLIAAKGKTLLLCDGGNKKKEFSIYAESLKSGDIIMAHDWAKDAESFQKIKNANIWYSWESRWEDGESEDQKFGLKETCEKYGINQIHADEFDNSVWFCGVKR